MKKRLICIIIALSLSGGLVGCKDIPEGAGQGTSGASSSADGGDLSDPYEYNVISIEDYIDKTTAGFLSQIAAFLSGYEFVYNSDGSPRVALPEEWYEFLNGPYAGNDKYKKNTNTLIYNERAGMWEPWSDDDYSIDILNQFLIRDMYDTYGAISSDIITRGWVGYDVYDLGGGAAKGGAKQLMKSYNLLPPFTGMAEYGNIYSWCGEPYIANETLGMSAAGMPDIASYLTDIFGSVTGEHDAVLWARFFSAMYAMAYFTQDITGLINSARVIFESGSWQNQVIDKIFELKEQYPDDWRRAAVQADRYCYREKYQTDKKMGETSINCAMILIGMIYGGGDYEETCKIISLAGHGGDSTTPVALGIVAVIGGMATVPEKVNEKIWYDGKGVIVNLPRNSSYKMYSAGLPERLPIADIISMYQSNFESILLENGGKIADGNYYIPKRELKANDFAAIKNRDFESGTLEGFTVKDNGTAEISSLANTGKHALKLIGGSEEENWAYTTVSGLKIGEIYSLTAFVFVTTNTTAYLFAREPGTDNYFCASINDQKSYVKRSLVFKATAEEMELGLVLEGKINEFKHAAFDDLSLMRINETNLSQANGVEISGRGKTGDGEYTGKVNFTASAGNGRQVYLKLSFTNASGKIIYAPVTVNSENRGAVPFYKTGTEAAAGAVFADTVYIPVLLSGGESVIALDFANDTVFIRAAEIVYLWDMW